ncbi:flagellar filament capping protein FliD, partial [Nocardioides massiliensis]
MATSSISGVASGLDTAGIINQLMALEAVPQAKLKSRVTSEQSVITTLQGLNTKLAQLTSRAEELTKPDGWRAYAATSSSAAVTVSTGTGVAPAGFALTVEDVARTHQLGFATAAALGDVVTGSGTTVLLDRLDGTGPVAIDAGDGTLSSLVAAINDPANETGLRATAVRVGEGSYRLLVESATTGAAQDFTLTAGDGSTLLGGATVRAGTDARIDLGTGITVTSASNTFADLAPGVSVTLGADAVAGTTATVDVRVDSSGLAGRVQSFVAQLNGVLADIDAATGSGTRAGALSGDSLVRGIRQNLLDTVFPADGTSMADLGVQTDRTGRLVFDADAFATAYAEDPAAVTEAFTAPTTGFLARVEGVARSASDRHDGTVTQAINGRNQTITRMQDSIEKWDLRLEMRRTTLT